MVANAKTLRTCKTGHQYYKSSDCPVCPICEKQQQPDAGFLSLLGAPARRALQNSGITTLLQLSTYTQTEILKLHGIGPSSIPTLKKCLQEQGLTFKSDTL